MEYLVKNQKLELKYEQDKGAWTYHIQIPNTRHIVGKWGSLKVSGTIDDYKIESINLAQIGSQDKIISINSRIRREINKSGGEIVNVTLHLLPMLKKADKKKVLKVIKIVKNKVLEIIKDSEKQYNWENDFFES